MDTVGLLVRVALVFGLLALTLWGVRRIDLGRTSTRTGAPVQVLATTRLGKGASVAVVRIGSGTYALGVTEHNVRLLTPAELPEPAASEPLTAADPTAPPTFAAALSAQVGQLLHPARRPGGDTRTSVEQQTAQH